MDILDISLILLSSFIIFLVVIQSKGSGLSIAQTSEDFGKFERRGGEKVLHHITIISIIAFIIMTAAIYLFA